MNSLPVIALASFGALTILGLSVIGPMRPRWHAVLLPAAPILGAALLAVVSSTAALVLSARGSLVVTVVVAAALVAVGAWRGRLRTTIDGRAILLAVAVWVTGAVAAAVALLPSFWVGDARVVSPTDGNDAYFYTAEATWMVDHPIHPVPDPGSVPGAGNATPADVPLKAALAFPLRIGQPLVHAALSVVTGQPPVRTAMVVAALWLALLAPAAFVALRLLGAGRVASFAGAALAASSAIGLQMYYQQTFDALLGSCLAVLAVALVVGAVERRLSPWLAALALAALVAVYTEYVVLIGPALALFVVVSRPQRLGRRLARAAWIVSAAFAFAPVAWVRGARALLLNRGGDSFGSPLFSDGAFAAIARFTGVVALGSTVPGGRRVVALTALLSGALVCGWALAVTVARRRRALWAGILVVGLGYIAYLTRGHQGYNQLRVVSLFVPLGVVAACAGWSALARRADRGLAPRPSLRVAAVIAAGLVVVLGAALNLRTAPSTLNAAAAHARHVDETYDEAASWVARDAAPGGSDVSVLDPDLFTQMWLAQSLRGEPLVAYPSLRPDYLGMVRYWGGEADPLLLLGPGAVADADPATLVAQNARFRLLDSRRGPVVAAIPANLPTWAPYPRADGTMSGPDLGTVVVIRSSGSSGHVRLEVGVPADVHQVSVRVQETGREFRSVVEGGEAAVDVDLGTLSVANLVVDLGADGIAGTDRIVLTGVLRAG